MIRMNPKRIENKNRNEQMFEHLIRTSAGVELVNAWNNRSRILSDPVMYGRTPKWTRSGCQFGSIDMPVGLIIECWQEGGFFVLPDSRRVFSFSGSALSGYCRGYAVNLMTGEVSAFESKVGNDVTFHSLLRARNKVLSGRKSVSESR